ncbi:MAG: Asd/ArgC dimerization domain-containing protein [Bryobacteraceae bacterium]
MGTPRLALVGGETLLGGELREVLEGRGTGAVITTYASSGEGNFGEEDGEAIYRDPIETQSLANEHAVLIAGSSEGASRAYGLAKAAGGRPVLIDCVGHLDHEPEARIISPFLEQPDLKASWLFVLAHPAATAVALVLTRLASYNQIRRAVLHIFEPASERGKRGLSELHQQTNGLLAFKTLDKDVFDVQLSFNLLSQYGEQAPSKLSDVEQRIEMHLATLLGDQRKLCVPMPSIRVIQAPVFHGYSISAWVEFESDVQADALGQALASAQVEVRGQNQEAPNAVEAASQSGLIAGDIRVDRNNARAAWFWIVGDNLRLTADAAADLVAAFRTDLQ